MSVDIILIRERLEAELARRTVNGIEQVSRSADAFDAAQELQSARVNDALSATTIRERMAIRQAIDRIDAGQYGLCLGCGDMIPDRRLNTIPWAALCIDCQQEWEALQTA